MSHATRLSTVELAALLCPLWRPRSYGKGDLVMSDMKASSLWHIHGHGYDLTEFVDVHPGGRLAILSAQGRDCTALFESYHPWNDKHRKVLSSFGPAPPPPDPFYEELKVGVREAFPLGSAETKMPSSTLCVISVCWCIMMYLFFVIRTYLACAIAGLLMALTGTRLAHEGGHFQITRSELVNRVALFLGYFLVGPSMIWYYRHVISHHAHTNQDEDVDVEYVWFVDMLPRWVKFLMLPFLAPISLIETGPKGFYDVFVAGSLCGHTVDVHLGGLLIETPIWLLVHGLFGPSLHGYLIFYTVSGAIFLPCSQVAHAILFPDPRDHLSWARLQVAESADFATDSKFWYHVAFGLTTQVEHHLFPGITNHCYDEIRHVVRRVCQRHGVQYIDISARKAFGALWHRYMLGNPIPLA